LIFGRIIKNFEETTYKNIVKLLKKLALVGKFGNFPDLIFIPLKVGSCTAMIIRQRNGFTKF